MSLRARTAIVGVGQTPFTRGTDCSTLELHLRAALEAIEDAGLTPADIDGVMPNELAGTIAEDFILNLGLRDLAFSSTIRTGGASFVSAIQSASLAIAGGVAKNVLLVAGRRGYSAQRVSLTSEGAIPPHPVMRHIDEFERPFGNTVASQWFAQAARRHMHEFGTTSEDFGRIAVAIRGHANRNPRALMYEKPLSLEQHQASAMIADPLRLFDCSLETDGATAIVLSSAERARDARKPPAFVLGLGEGHGDPPTSITQKRDLTRIEGLEIAARRAYAMAGIGPDAIDAAQIYDGFTWIVLASLEALGFCKRGEGRDFVRDGRIALGGALPVNTSGGLLSEGHCSGANLVSEAVRQLRREVEPERQVRDCECVLVTGEGDFHEGAALVLGRDR
ncbi:MAG: transporter [Spirochaetaceae bacterium]|nr:transporter [Spirochaetaceae bacterium]